MRSIPPLLMCLLVALMLTTPIVGFPARSVEGKAHDSHRDNVASQVLQLSTATPSAAPTTETATEVLPHRPSTPTSPSGRERFKPPRGTRLASRLHQLVETEQRGNLAEKATLLAAHLDGNQIRVSIETQPGRKGDAVAAIRAAGGRVRIVAPTLDSISALVPVSALPILAQHPSVKWQEAFDRLGDGLSQVVPTWH